MRTTSQNPLNTLDQAIRFASIFSKELQREAKTARAYRVFVSLTEGEFDALVAFLSWRVRGQILKELMKDE